MRRSSIKLSFEVGDCGSDAVDADVELAEVERDGDLGRLAGLDTDLPESDEPVRWPHVGARRHRCTVTAAAIACRILRCRYRDDDAGRLVRRM